MKFRIGDKVKLVKSLSNFNKVYTIREFVSYKDGLNGFIHKYFLDGISDAIHEKNLELAVAENRNERLNKLGI